MVYERTGYAPWSLTREAGVQSATVDSEISVPQYLQPIVDTGIIDEKGDWKGIKSSDEQFFAFQKDEGIPNTGEILTPSVNPDNTWPLDMTGYNDLFIAIKPDRTGNYAITAVMGPDTLKFANLGPVNPAATLKGALDRNDLDTVLVDSAEALTADVWNIFIIGNQLRNQKLLQFKIVNNSGDSAVIETAFMRMV